jgi:L-threonylcarbamoyladenylate synthase
VSQESIAQIVGYTPAIASSSDTPEAPGMLKSHYAPKIPLVIGNISDLLNLREELSISILSFNKTYNHPKIIKAIDLSPSGDVHEAARNLFTAMHELEDSGADIILTELLPNVGIGMAINDRLTRAAS